MAGYSVPGEYVEGMFLIKEVQKESVEKVRNMTFVDGDVLIASYPRTGTTWMQELVWTVTKQGDLTEALSEPFYSRVLYLEFGDKVISDTAGIDKLKNKQRPTILKTHLPANFLERAIKEARVKVIVPVRNPKDTMISYYHFYRAYQGVGNFPGTWNDFFELYKAKKLLYGDFFDWYASWLPYMERPNVQLFAYEDMKADIMSVIQRLCAFLETSLTEDQVETIVKHTSFKSMSANKMTNYTDIPLLRQDISPFIRKGEVGDWNNYFTEEQSRLVDDEYETRLEKKGLVLKFGLHCE